MISQNFLSGAAFMGHPGVYIGRPSFTSHSDIHFVEMQLFQEEENRRRTAV